MRVPLLVLFVFIRGIFLHSRVTGACPVTMDWIMRVNVRTTTTATTCPSVSAEHCIYTGGTVAVTKPRASTTVLVVQLLLYCVPWPRGYF